MQQVSGSLLGKFFARKVNRILRSNESRGAARQATARREADKLLQQRQQFASAADQSEGSGIATGAEREFERVIRQPER